MADRHVSELGEESAKLEGAAADAIREAAELEARVRRLAAAFHEHPRLTEHGRIRPAPRVWPGSSSGGVLRAQRSSSPAEASAWSERP